MRIFHIVLTIIICLAIVCLLIVAAFLFSTAVTRAAEQPECHRLQDFIKQLAARYEEAPVSVGPWGDDDKAMMILFANPKTGTWTLLRSGSDGCTTAMISGKEFSSHDYVKPVTGDPA